MLGVLRFISIVIIACAVGVTIMMILGRVIDSSIAFVGAIIITNSLLMLANKYDLIKPQK